MTITFEQIAGLRAGDVVELVDLQHPDVVHRGVLHAVRLFNGTELRLGSMFRIRRVDGLTHLADNFELTMISAPRPLYINHHRGEPAAGDVVRDADGELWLRDGFTTWQGVESTCEQAHQDTGLALPLTLLVDGKTRQVVE